MKASLKLRDDQNHLNDHHLHHQNPLLRIKVPISILGLPFISSFTAGDPKDLSFNLHSNFLHGPSLKLSYSPTTTTTSTTISNHHHNPISISLKSGVGLFGSPNNSPFIISAHFNPFGNHNPTFSLQIKPQFGDFSLSKTTVSSSLPTPNPNPNPNPNVVLPKENGGFPYNGVMPDRRYFHGGEDGFFSGVAVKAKTVFPVVKAATVKFRWGVNFPPDSVEKLKLPFLTIDKVSIERVEEGLTVPVEEKVQLKSGFDGVSGKVQDLEMLKGICFWMRKEVESLQSENNAIKASLEEMKLRGSKRSNSESKNGGRNTAPVTPSVESSKNKKSGAGENGKRELKKFSGTENSSNDVGEELKRAIMAASSNGV